jgi:hypothetical protein
MGIESFNAPEKNSSVYEKEGSFIALAEKARGLLSFEQTESFSGRLLRASTLAAVTTLAACSKDPVSVDVQDPENAHHQSVIEYRLSQARQESMEKREVINEARGLAEELGIDTSQGLSFVQEGLVITEINGIKIPDSYHTEEEQEEINQARQVRVDLQSDTNSRVHRSASPDMYDPNEF